MPDGLTTADLYRTVLDRSAAAPAFDPREIRLSEAGQCGRRQTLRALGYPPDAPDDRQLSIFLSGHQHEDAIYRLWAGRFPRRVKRQVPVRTPYGTGHIDIWVAPLRHLVESKSTTQKMADQLPLAAHVDQVQLYLHFWGAARGATAELAYRIKETGEIVSVPVVYDRERARQLVANLIEIQARITLTGEPLPVPDTYTAFAFPCAWGAGRCAYWSHCWGAAAPRLEGREPVADAPQLARDAAEYAALRERRQALEAQADVLKARQAVLEDGFARVLDAAGASVLTAGPWRIRRTRVPGRVTWDGDAAIADGVVDAAALAPYRRVTAGFARWTIKSHTPKEVP